MGMDAYIFRARSKKAFETDNWYGSDAVTEVWYTRKYWDLINKLSFLQDKEDQGACEYIKLTQENLEEMINIATHTPDYFDGFDSVPALCKILHDYDEDEENGWHYYFEYDY